VGRTIGVIVTAVNLGGSTPATSGRTAAVKPLPPTNTVAPTISGAPSPGQSLTCANGSWTPAPTGFSDQWNRDGAPISGATADTYLVIAGDQGHALTCTVAASNDGGTGSPATSSAVNVPAAVSAKPVNTSPPTITGTPLPGNTLTCNPGTWTGSPTSFDYQWNRDTSEIAGATQQKYQVQIADEGHGVGCDVGAANGGGASSATASAPVIVAMKGTLNCPKPSGQISGRAVGPLSLGMKQSRARSTLSRFAVTRNHFDDFCLYGGWGIRAGYPSSRLLGALARGLRSQVAKKIVIALTANPFYALNGVSPGMSLSAAQARLHPGEPFHIGLNDWYVASAGAANGVLKVRGGIVQEVGLMSKQLTRTRKAQGWVLVSFK
jgi:hypothetical protein